MCQVLFLLPDLYQHFDKNWKSVYRDRWWQVKTCTPKTVRLKQIILQQYVLTHTSNCNAIEVEKSIRSAECKTSYRLYRDKRGNSWAATTLLGTGGALQLYMLAVIIIIIIIKTLFNERTHLTRSIFHEALKYNIFTRHIQM